MELNNKVENFYNKHRSTIILASHTRTGLESILRDLFQEMYELGYADGRKPSDEDIKSCIAMCLTDANEQRFKDYDTNLKDCLAWLEKKGEKKLRVKPKFKVGDWVVREYTKEINQVLDVKRINDEHFGYTLDDGTYFSGSWESSYHLWTIEDAKDGDVLATSTGAFIYNGNNGGGSCPGSYCGIDTLGGFKTGVEHHWTGKPVFPSTKEQRDLLFKRMKEAGYEWDAEKKELKEIEQKSQRIILAEAKGALYDNPAWSEEDCYVYNEILKRVADGKLYEHDLEYIYTWLKSLKDRVQSQKEWSEDDEANLTQLHKLIVKRAYEEYEIDTEDETLYGKWAKLDNWLKSLKPQPQWKPSEEQIQALEYQVNSTYKDSLQYRASKELLEQLKKL